MAKPGVVIDRRFLNHDTGHGHPERPQRVEVLLDLVARSEGHLTPIAARMATGDELALVHDGAYVEDVSATRHHEHYAFDADTPTSAGSFETASLAAGGVLSLLDAVVAGEVANGFAFVRPPGHHAERHRAMGFCLFNNVAVGAAYLRERHGLERVLIVDWDLHHGNGTQHMFEREPGVLFVSTHQFPYYPGTGAIDEIGRGDGEGFTVNLPMPAGCGDPEYIDLFERFVVPVAQQFEPQFVLISAGFDAHGADPLGGMRVSELGFRRMARMLLDVAAESCQGRCAAILEGGYDLGAIRSSSLAVLEEMAGQAVEWPQLPASRVEPLAQRIRQRQSDFWKF